MDNKEITIVDDVDEHFFNSIRNLKQIVKREKEYKKKIDNYEEVFEELYFFIEAIMVKMEELSTDRRVPYLYNQWAQIIINEWNKKHGHY